MGQNREKTFSAYETQHFLFENISKQNRPQHCASDIRRFKNVLRRKIFQIDFSFRFLVFVFSMIINFSSVLKPDFGQQSLSKRRNLISTQSCAACRCIKYYKGCLLRLLLQLKAKKQQITSNTSILAYRYQTFLIKFFDPFLAHPNFYFSKTDHL